jgi:gluconolactonase
LLFSDIPANTIHRLTPPAAIDVFRQPSGNANGLGVDEAGLLIACEHSGRRVSRTLASGDVIDVATAWQGDPLNSPNDNITRSDGTIYFTDPGYGLTGPSAIGFFGVYRVEPGTPPTLHLVADDMSAPNGIALSPDETTLYVTDSEDDFVRSYDVAPDGSTSAPTPFVPSIPSPDGMAVDDAGNLYFSSGDGIVVVRPSGEPWGTISTASIGQQPANCTFGGPDRKTLYITARTGLYRVELNIPGKP